MDMGLGEAIQMAVAFGGIALIIWASAKAKLEHRKLDMLRGLPVTPITAHNDDAVLAELRALKQQIGEMQSTGHQFDIAFDAALERMEQRVARLETKSAAAIATQTEGTGVLRAGQ